MSRGESSTYINNKLKNLTQILKLTFKEFFEIKSNLGIIYRCTFSVINPLPSPNSILFLDSIANLLALSANIFAISAF